MSNVKAVKQLLASSRIQVLQFTHIGLIFLDITTILNRKLRETIFILVEVPPVLILQQLSTIDVIVRFELSKRLQTP